MTQVPAALARSVLDHYPRFKRAGAFLDADETWIGQIQPFLRCRGDELLQVIDDLRFGEQVLLQEGALAHSPSCCRNHSDLGIKVDLEGIDEDRFSVRLVVWPPPVHPKVFALFPEISSRVFKTQPHLFQSEATRRIAELPNPMPDALCTYRPGDGEWSWACGDLVLFLDFVAIYLAKHSIWLRSGGEAGGLWIGPQASHDPRDLIAELKPTGECRCGSGRPYFACHLGTDEIRARQLILR